jgi:hypothetical protein
MDDQREPPIRPVHSSAEDDNARMTNFNSW